MGTPELEPCLKQDKSTKRPWQAAFGATVIDQHGRAIIKTAGETEERLANASLIVEAVNSHEAHKRCAQALKPFAKLADTWTVATAAMKESTLLTLSNGERMCGVDAACFLEAAEALVALEKANG